MTLYSKVDKKSYAKVGNKIKIILSPYGIGKEDFNMWNLPVGSTHSIVDRPNRKAKKNGDFGVWVEGVEEPVFVWNFMWVPFLPVTTVRKRTIERDERVRKNHNQNVPIHKRTK